MMRGVVKREGDWIVCQYQGDADVYPTLKIRRHSDSERERMLKFLFGIREEV